MFCFSRIFVALFLSMLIVSCASIDDRVPDKITVDSANYKYAAWRLNSSQEFEAINVLLDEVDVLIENQNVNTAADKLERILRIKPDYAPAWSRLSWLALQMNSPKRSVQMAKRSNSFAHSNLELQSLNWSFIRAASQQLNDDETYIRATQKIESLKAF